MGYNRVTIFMQKIFLIVAAMAALLLTSCQKDKEGVFNPKHKIARIYTEDTNGDKELSETYFWNKDVLERIEYAESDEVLKFEYNKNNQIIKVNALSSNELVYFADVTYKNGQYDNVSIHVRGETEFVLTFSFTYSKKKIKTMKLKVPLEDIFGNLGEKSYPLFNRIMSLFMPATLPLDMVIKSMDSKQDPTWDLEVTYTFDWNGDNVAKMNAGNISISFSGYDKKLNPFQGFTVSQSFNPINLSKNNPAKLTYNISGEISSINYAYTYDGDVPVKVVATILGDLINILPGSGAFSNGVRYYEYNK